MDDIQESLLGDTQPVSRHSMGMGKLSDPSIVFVRQFRWTLGSKVLDEHFVKNVKFDFKSQTLHLEAYEVVCNDTINIHDWLESDLSKETLFFTTYDGCGHPIYTYEISDIALESDTAVYDYAASDEVTRKLSLTYGNIKRIFHSKGNKDVIYKKKFDWTMSVDNGVAKKVKLVSRPNLTIEETEINFLNAKTWIPGKANWQDLCVELDRQSRCLLQPLMNGKDRSVQLNLLDGCGDVLETWHLKNVRVSKMKDEEEKVHLTLKYDEVRYESASKPEVSTVINTEVPHV